MYNLTTLEFKRLLDLIKVSKKLNFIGYANGIAINNVKFGIIDNNIINTFTTNTLNKNVNTLNKLLNIGNSIDINIDNNQLSITIQTVNGDLNVVINDKTKIKLR